MIFFALATSGNEIFTKALRMFYDGQYDPFTFKTFATLWSNGDLMISEMRTRPAILRPYVYREE